MNPKPESVYISFRTQFENLGDCIINWLLMKKLAETRDVHILCSSTPAWLRTRLQSHSRFFVYENSAKWYQRAIQELVAGKHRLVFQFKPGHYATDGFRGNVKSVAMMGFTALCYVCGIKFRRMGVSLGKQTKLSRLAESWMGSIHDPYCLRDHESVETARKIGIEKAKYSPDMAFLLPYDDSDFESRRKMAICFRKRPWTEDGAKRKRLEQGVKEIESTHDFSSVIVSQVSLDHELLASFAVSMECSAVMFGQSESSAAEIFDTYRQCQYAISNRLHCLVFAWAHGAIPIPVVDPNHDQKVIDLFNTIGLSDLLIEIDDIGNLPNHVNHIHEEQAAWRVRIKEVFSRAQTELSQLFEPQSGNT